MLFASRSLEPVDLRPYRPLLEAGLIRRFYLDEMPELANAPLGLSILYLIREAENEAPQFARGLVTRARSEIADEELRIDLVQLIETVMIYKLARLSRGQPRTLPPRHSGCRHRNHTDFSARNR